MSIRLTSARTRRHAAFTVLELLVVVAVIAILIAILVPSLRRARQQAFQVKCAAHLRAMGQGILYYTLDPQNGNGYLPYLGFSSRGRFWIKQIMPYMQVKRSKAGSRDAFFWCPADDDPMYVILTGPQAGQGATLEDKIRADAASGTTGGPRRAAATGSNRYLGPMIEPLSYAASEQILDPRPEPHTAFTRKITELARPYCQVLVADTVRPGLWTFDWVALIKFEAPDPVRQIAYRRHYGGMDPRTNGPNLLFADMHVEWRSLTYVIDQLHCCQDFTYPEWNVQAIFQAERCGSTSESRR